MALSVRLTFDIELCMFRLVLAVNLNFSSACRVVRTMMNLVGTLSSSIDPDPDQYKPALNETVLE